MSTREFRIGTTGQGLYEFTRDVAEWVEEDAPDEAVLTLFLRHTSASLVIQENVDPDVQTDLHGFFNRLVPPTTHPSQSWMVHTYEGPDDMPAHVKAALLPVSLQIPVVAGRMVLGTWQGIYLFEHRDQPHSRHVFAMLR
ncbi:secondary thiamine-phosphate synthase enzyme YjbQ [Thioclava sp. GXIMD4216]|uniref:secondary thiamine-phosphate synthase enzyme YjbQ n=1 Tax=Thioclava sp. GXIMD4216 TaxID=3131929 RepID=UPI0030CD1762